MRQSLASVIIPAVFGSWGMLKKSAQMSFLMFFQGKKRKEEVDFFNFQGVDFKQIHLWRFVDILLPFLNP